MTVIVFLFFSVSVLWHYLYIVCAVEMSMVSISARFSTS